jgi:hypothetical protein
MKSLFLILYLLNAKTNENLAAFENNTSTAKVPSVKILLGNHKKCTGLQDAVFVILDKYDRTGAGIVKQKFYVNENNEVVITGVPDGKYLATVQCLGIHSDYSQHTIRVIKGKQAILKLNLHDSEVFSREDVIIPADQIRLDKLLVTNNR